MNYKTHTLTNGLKLIHKNDDGPVSYCGLVINTGSRDENENEQGMAHFIEHLLFKGTAKRRSGHIINRLENVGGELNAFTSKEETVVYSTILNEYLDRAVELIADISLHSTFPQKEIDKEVVIVIDEIQSYNDSPSELIYDEFENLIFNGHSIGHNILGVPELLKKYTTQDAIEFVNKNYRLDEMVFFCIGKINTQQLIHKVEKHFQWNEVARTPRNQRQAPSIPYQATQQTITKNTHQVHFMVGNRAYNMHHPNRMGMYLLNNILGGPGMNSLLNLSLREKHGLVYNVESTYQPFTDTGMWSVYFGCDPENAAKCEALVYKELDKLCSQEFSDTQLKKYKLQLIGQMAIASENKENLALSIGKSFLRYGKVDDLEKIKKSIESVSASQLMEIARDIFQKEKLSVLKYL